MHILCFRSTIHQQFQKNLKSGKSPTIKTQQALPMAEIATTSSASRRALIQVIQSWKALAPSRRTPSFLKSHVFEKPKFASSSFYFVNFGIFLKTYFNWLMN
ncbi:hypothetical protein HAX54_044435 [Datura stramonium]|uniref:Uncharacterized protein n=1 Tax=Datura stramonium TaxID=4076 RepID=A0ABS8SP71_DATST|nr:hypothetical protein [Datura stramonium]